MGALAERAPAARARPRVVPKKAARPRIASGVVWIVVVAALLAGVVAMNVAVLQLNLRLDELARERARLRAETAELSSRLSSASAAARIQALAARRLGLAPSDPAETTYIELGRR